MYRQVEQQKMLKLKEQSDSTIKKLNSEIQVMNEISLYTSTSIQFFWFISWIQIVPKESIHIGENICHVLTFSF